MKRLPLAVLSSLMLGSVLTVPVMAETYSTAQLEQQNYSDAELDSLLAPIALYPDTVLTHILIASTYPLEVVAADRWRQAHSELSAEDVESAVEKFDWDPSVKAITPFAEILNTMASDLDWLQTLGDNVLISQSRVLARVQVLRQHALNSGGLQSSNYQRVEKDSDVIVIEPVRKETVYVPYYDTRVVYGDWWHPIRPIYWHHPRHYHHAGGFYWSPSIHLSTFFYFGGIQWHDRHVIISRTPVKRYYYGRDIKRVYSREYQPWQHSREHRRVRYSNRVVHSGGQRYTTPRPLIKRKVDYQHSSNRSHNPVIKAPGARGNVIDRQDRIKVSNGQKMKNSLPPSFDKPASTASFKERAKTPRSTNEVLKRQRPSASTFDRPKRPSHDVKQRSIERHHAVRQTTRAREQIKGDRMIRRSKD